MPSVSLRFRGLVYISCLVLAVGLSALGDSVTYLCPGIPIHPDLRLDRASIEDINALQESGAVTSVDLVHARASFLSTDLFFNAKY